MNNYGDLIAEYSVGNKRLFFGMKKDGNYYFGDNITKEIEINNKANISRGYSRIMFVKNSIKDKEYLFSIGFESSNVEIYNIEEEKYLLLPSISFLGREIYSYWPELTELSLNDNKKEYLISYLYFLYDNGDDTRRDFVFNKFDFFDFELQPLDQSKEVIIEIHYVHQRISVSFVSDEKIFIFYLTRPYFMLEIYDYNLQKISGSINIDKCLGDFPWHVVFFMYGSYLKDDYIFLLYYTIKKTLTIKVGKIGKENLNFQEMIYSFINSTVCNNVYLYYHVLYNECTKMSNERIAYVFRHETDETILNIILFDLYNNYQNMKIRIYKNTFNNYKIKAHPTCITYNGLLVFSSTVEGADEIYFQFF